MQKRILSSALILIFGLLPVAPAIAEQSVLSAPPQTDWEQRQAQANALQQAGSARQAAAQKLLDESEAECHKKFLVNSCLIDARKVYNQQRNEARQQENEGLAIERQIKKEQLNERDRQREAEAAQKEQTLQQRQAETTARRQQAANEQSASEADKAKKAAEGSRRKAADAERIAKKRADHEARVAAKKAAAAKRAASN